MSTLAIKAEGLSKRYKVAAVRPHNTLRDQLADTMKTLFQGNGRRSSTAPSNVFWALKDASFEIQEGETVGIIGANGAGKSTLLKILSRVTEPSYGRAKVHGRVGSLLEVGTGFHYELSGRENLYLSGAILGMKKAEIDRKFDEIVAFAEIEKFIDMPVKHYSSGMYVRLAFAVTAHLDPDILLIDEILSVGDLAFQRKCLDHAERLRSSNATLLFVSHNMFSIKAMCQRVIYLSHGEVCFDGSTDEAINLYEKDSRLMTAPWAVHLVGKDPTQRPVYITDVELLDDHGRPCHVFDYGRRMRVRLRFEVRDTLVDPNFSVTIFRFDDVPCCNFNTAMDGFPISSLSGNGCIELLTPPLKLVAERYGIQVTVWDADFGNLYAAQVAATFHVRHEILNRHFGVFHESGQWAWREREPRASQIGWAEESHD